MTSQLTLGKMPRRLYPVTPTKLTTWQDCPRKFRFTYLEKRTKGGPWAHNTVGAVVHLALRNWWDLPLARRTPAGAAGLVRSGWQDDGFRDEEQSRSWRERAADMTQRYCQNLDPQVQPLGIERTVGVPVASMTVSGRVDRIDEGPPAPDGSLTAVIVDYKTGRRILTEDDARGSLALALYAVAAQRTLRRDCRVVELHHLPTGDVARWEHSAEGLARQVRRADAVAVAARDAQGLWQSGLDVVALRAGETGQGVRADPEVDAVLPPQPGPLCSWCDFRRICPAGRDASPSLAPWAGLAETSEPSEPSDP